MSTMSEKKVDEDTVAAKLALEEKKRNRGIVDELFLRVGEKIGTVEQTCFSSEFTSEVRKFVEYHTLVKNLVESLDSVLQMNPQVLATGSVQAPEKMDCHEVMAQAIKSFRKNAAPTEKKNSLVTAEAVLKRLALMNRDFQKKGRNSILNMRRFVSAIYEQFLTQQRDVGKARDLMDTARHELKQTKTSEQVEQKGRIYEQSVLQFDELAGLTMQSCENLPSAMSDHQLEMLDFFDTCAEHHRLAASVLSENLKQMNIVLTKY